MRKLNPPLHSLAAILDLCANSLKNRELAGRLRSSLPLLSLAEFTYGELRQASNLYTIPPNSHSKWTG